MRRREWRSAAVFLRFCENHRLIRSTGIHLHFCTDQASGAAAAAGGGERGTGAHHTGAWAKVLLENSLLDHQHKGVPDCTDVGGAQGAGEQGKLAEIFTHTIDLQGLQK
jgi:hypothetical protein